MKKNIIKFGKKEIESRITPKIKQLLDGVTPEKKGSNYNGYGYSDWTYIYNVDKITFSKISELINKPKKITPKKTEKQKEQEWVNRLVKLTGIAKKEANEIKKQKLNYKLEKIQELEERQYESFSQKRASLIKKMERENPLRRITDTDHAQAILEAHRRHVSTNYDSLLSELHEMEKNGEIEKGQSKEIARQNKRSIRINE